MSGIQIKYPALTIKAGKRAFARICEQGLQAADVSTIPGAAGGPKPLGLQGLDLALFGEWLPRAPRARTLIGASIGSWRFASACLPDPVQGLRRLAELYTHLQFNKKSTLADVSNACTEMLNQLLNGQDASILSNPNYRLNVMVVKSLGLLAHDHKGLLALGLSSVIGRNLLSRSQLGRNFERVILHDPRQTPPLNALNDFPSRALKLSQENLRHALLASGSIPMVMQGIRDIPGAGAGTYRDGGLLDYHLDLPYDGSGIVLYPHFTDKVIPGWFDKMTPWRRGDAQQLADVVLLSPSPEYLARLPGGKLPDRKDFRRYMGNDATRIRHWKNAISESERLGDEFLSLCDNNHIAQRMQTL
ncbi:patatin-like phospholipase family protein [Ectopseudomonas mendocina]|uniref:Patatin-like phospholipase family protein n=1 Tax=Ectopseudomonas mendocina TaxID=300 RepID=A0ABZ2RIR4_ECTME